MSLFSLSEIIEPWGKFSPANLTLTTQNQSGEKKNLIKGKSIAPAEFLPTFFGFINARQWLNWNVIFFFSLSETLRNVVDQLLSFFFSLSGQREKKRKKKKRNWSPMSISLDHDGFKRGSIMSAWLRKHLHCLPHICHVWFSCLPAVYRSILITAVKPKITNKGKCRFDKAGIYNK